MCRRVSVVFLLVTLSLFLVVPPDVACAVAAEAEESTGRQVVSQFHQKGMVVDQALQDILDSCVENDGVPDEYRDAVEARIEAILARFPEQQTACAESVPAGFGQNEGFELEAVKEAVADAIAKKSRLERALSRLPRVEKTANADELVGLARQRVEQYDPQSPYVASSAEVVEVLDYLSEYGAEVDREVVEASSRFWYEGQSISEKGREAITIGVLVALATLGAIEGVVLYYYDYKVHEEEFTCLGVVKAAYVGAIMGMLGKVLQAVKYAQYFLNTADALEVCGIASDTIAQIYDLPFEQVFTGACSTTSIGVDWIMDLVADLVWAPSPIRGPTILACSALDSEELRKGGLSGVRSWITDELVPTIRDEQGLKFMTIQSTTEAHLAASGLDSSDLPNVGGRLDLTNQSTGRDVGLFLTSDLADYEIGVSPNQAGSYTVRLKVLRNRVEATVATMYYSAVVPNDDTVFSGSLNIGQVFSSAGSVEGPHVFRIEVENTSENWTEWVTDRDGNPVEWDVEIRSNRKPSISLDCINLIGVVSCSMFIVDPDDTRPTGVYLTVDGVDQDLTGDLPVSGVDWSEGCTLTKNQSMSEGIYEVRARVSDGEYTSYSGATRDLRVATLPYPVFPAASLSNVGEAGSCSVRWEDSLGGIEGQTIFLHTANDGYFTSPSGELIQSVVTGGTGWAYFNYTPMETGYHTLTVAVDGYELDQTTGYVAPGCEPPDRPYLDSPYNGEDELPTAVNLEWWTDEDTQSYDLYFGTEYPPPLINNVPYQVDDIVYPVTSLSPGTEYFWQVVAHGACDPNQTTPSWLSHFFTLGAPESPTLISPPDGATDQPTGLVVDWENVTAPGTFLYDLYLGEGEDPPFNESMGTRTQKLFDGSAPENTLAASTTYHWKVRAYSAEDPNLYSDSAVWSFTTGTGGSETINISAFKDAGLRGGSFGNTNYGGEFGGDAEQRFYGCGNGDDFFSDPGDAPLKGAVQFDLTVIPAGTEIINATLTLQPVQGSNLPGTTSTMYFDPFQSSWSESSITWNNRPAVNTAYRVEGVFPPSGWHPLNNDLTSLVQAWVDGTITNHGLLYSIPAWESVAGRYIMFHQRESQADQGNAAVLEITYGVPCSQTDPPVLVSPANGASDLESSVVLDWSDVTGASNYNVYFGTSPSPGFVELVTTSQTTINDLESGTTYYWQIEALADCDGTVTSASGVWSFSTTSCLAPPAFSQVAPADGASGVGHLVTLTWAAPGGASSYQVFAGTNNPPTTLVGDVTTTSAPLYTLPGRTYFWFVRAVADCDGSLTTDTPITAFSTASAPMANAGDDRSVVAGETTVLGGSPTAMGGSGPYTYSWDITPGADWSIDSLTVANPVFTPGSAGEFWCEVTVTDSLGFDSIPSLVKIDAIEAGIFADGFESHDTSAWSLTVP